MLDPDFIKERITQLRLEKGVSEYQMSYDLGRSRSYIYNISSGRSLPPMTEFLQICDYFGITPAQFFDTSSNNSALLATAVNELAKLNDDDLLLIMNVVRTLGAASDNALYPCTAAGKTAASHSIKTRSRGGTCRCRA